MKYQSAEQLRELAAVVAVPIQKMTRRERLTHWANLLDHHGGSIEALYRIEYLSEADRRAYTGGETTPLAIAFRDPVLQADGLTGNTLGDAMDYFEMSDEDAHYLLCDCHYMGALTGSGLAGRLRRYASGGLMGWVGGIFAGHSG